MSIGIFSQAGGKQKTENLYLYTYLLHLWHI